MVVYLSVFAGRRRFLNVLIAYVRPLLQENVINRAHFWDYCRLQMDRAFLQGVPGVVAKAAGAGGGARTRGSRTTTGGTLLLLLFAFASAGVRGAVFRGRFDRVAGLFRFRSCFASEALRQGAAVRHG